MPSLRIGFAPLLLAPLALLTAACAHTAGSGAVPPPPTQATPATPAPVAGPTPSSPAPAPPAAPGAANPSAAGPVSPASAGPAAAAPSAASARTAPAAPRRPPPGTGAAPRTQPPATAAPASAKATTPAAAALDLNGLEQRLRDTRAIGVFTKLSLKNQVDDLLTEFRTYHKGRVPPTLTQLREQYEVLLMKVVTLLQDGDPSLAGAVASSREAIWAVLTDPVKFANI